MRNPLKNTPTIIFAALVPIVIGAALLIFNSTPATYEKADVKTAVWVLDINDAVLGTDSLGTLTANLYEETRGERRTEVLNPIINDIERLLGNTNRETPALLADLLRDLSVEHPSEEIRRNAYIAMVVALDSEIMDYDAPFQSRSEFVFN
ncbi:hypothetical protein QA596_10165 [Balneolales bacterium ANBcel1]|nr:hypothetical protein [Balneolales bacterium ANBcel1]